MEKVFDDLKSWVLDCGGSVHQALYRKDGAMYAQEKIGKGETLIFLPERFHLNPKRFDELNPPHSFDNDIEKVVFFFLTEYKKEDSIFQPYFASLPSLEYFKENHPYFLEDDTLEVLRSFNHRIYTTLNRFKNHTQKFHQQFQNLFNLKDIQWAYANFLTRAFEGSAMLPCVDLFNHNSSFGIGIDECTIHAGSDFKKDAEVFISYGAHYDTLELWMSFGFVDPHAQHIVGLHNVKNRDSKPLFPNEDYLTEAGPSPTLAKKVEKHPKIKSIFEKLYEEITIPDSFSSDHPLIQTCYNTLITRKEILGQSF